MTPSVSTATTAPLPTIVLDPSTSRPASLVAKVAGDLIGAAARELATGAARALGSAISSSTSSAAKSARVRAAGAGYASALSSAASIASSKKKTSISSKASSSSKTSTSSKTSKAKANDGLAFLKDPKLSIEDKLMLLLAQLNQKYESEMQQHMQRLAGEEPSSAAPKSSGSTTTKKSSGFLGGLVSAVAGVVNTAVPGIGAVANVLGDKTVQSILKSVGGPVLGAAATALGFPEAAPLLVKYGPQIADVVGKVAKELDSPAKSSSSPSGSTSSGKASGSGSGTTGKASEGDTQLELLQLQRLQDGQKRMFELASNIFRSLHDTRAAIIGNIR